MASTIHPSDNATLLFYPSLPDREIDKYSQRFTDVDDLQLTHKGKGKKLHKRQISEAIPSTERDEQAVTKVATSKEGTRKSARKPKSRS